MQGAQRLRRQRLRADARQRRFGALEHRDARIQGVYGFVKRVDSSLASGGSRIIRARDGVIARIVYDRDHAVLLNRLQKLRRDERVGYSWIAVLVGSGPRVLEPEELLPNDEHDNANHDEPNDDASIVVARAFELRVVLWHALCLPIARMLRFLFVIGEVTHTLRASRCRCRAGCGSARRNRGRTRQ